MALKVGQRVHVNLGCVKKGTIRIIRTTDACPLTDIIGVEFDENVGGHMLKTGEMFHCRNGYGLWMEEKSLSPFTIYDLMLEVINGI